jgi:TPR repeat protein
MAHDVFICHSAKDKTTADAVCAMLEANGVRCWIAPRDVMPGMEWSECIIEAIEECRIMVLVFTAHANESPQIRREIERAVNHGVAILPLRMEDILPGRALEYFIGNVHWLDALTPPLESHLKNLAGTVKVLLGRLPARNVLEHVTPEIPDMAASVAAADSAARVDMDDKRETHPAFVAQAPSTAQTSPAAQSSPPAQSPSATSSSFEAQVPSAAQATSDTKPQVAKPAERTRKLRAVTVVPIAAVLLVGIVIAVLTVRHERQVEATKLAQQRAQAAQESLNKIAAAERASRAATNNADKSPSSTPSPAVDPTDWKSKDMFGLMLDAQFGVPEAEAEVGNRYFYGRNGETKDYSQALVWYQKAAAQGNANAQNNLGVMYANGWGVPMNLAQAVLWYRKAADQGDVTAETNLGNHYKNGIGVAMDNAQALLWYQKAAAKNDMKAEYNLGVFYQYGYGVTKDLVQARAWYQKSANQGYADAQKKLKELNGNN